MSAYRNTDKGYQYFLTGRSRFTTSLTKTASEVASSWETAKLSLNTTMETRQFYSIHCQITKYKFPVKMGKHGADSLLTTLCYYNMLGPMIETESGNEYYGIKEFPELHCKLWTTVTI